MYAQNEPAMKNNETLLNELPCGFHTIEANDKILDNQKYLLALFQASQNLKKTNTGGLAKLLKLKTGAKVMLKVNIVTQDCVINYQTGIFIHIEFAQGSARKVYLNFSYEQAGSKAIRLSYLGRRNSWVPIEKCETGTSTKKGSALPFIKRTKFQLALAQASICCF